MQNIFEFYAVIFLYNAQFSWTFKKTPLTLLHACLTRKTECTKITLSASTMNCNERIDESLMEPALLFYFNSLLPRQGCC